MFVGLGALFGRAVWECCMGCAFWLLLCGASFVVLAWPDVVGDCFWCWLLVLAVGLVLVFTLVVGRSTTRNSKLGLTSEPEASHAKPTDSAVGNMICASARTSANVEANTTNTSKIRV